MKKFKCPICKEVPDTYMMISKTVWSTKFENSFEDFEKDVPKLVSTSELGDDEMPWEAKCPKCYYVFDEKLDIIEE